MGKYIYKKDGIDYILGLHKENKQNMDVTKKFLGKIWKRRQNPNSAYNRNHRDHNYVNDQ